MNERPLSPTLKNFALEALRGVGVDVSEFGWQMAKGPWGHLQVSVVNHARTGFFFMFDMGNNGLFHPQAYPSVPEGELDSNGLKSVFAWWAARIAPELLAPDLWGLSQQQARMNTDPNEDNRPMTVDEQQRAVDGLDQVARLIEESEPDLPMEKRQAVRARFQYLKAATARLGRIDWLSMVIGQMFSMAAEKLITLQTFTSIYNVAGTVFTNALGMAPAIIKALSGGQ